MFKTSAVSRQAIWTPVASITGQMAGAVQNASWLYLSAARRLDARQLILCLVILAACMLMADPVMAQTTAGSGAGAGGIGNITTFLQNLVNLITGTAGKLIAVLAICFVGIGALMGALSLRTAGGVILGVMLIFSASWIVDQIIT